MNAAVFPRVVPVSSDLLDLIDAVCPEGDGYRAPDAVRAVEDTEPVVVHPNAMHIDTEMSWERAKRAYRERWGKCAKGAKGSVSAKVIRMTLETIADNAPLCRAELRIRMRRRCLTPARQVDRALVELLRRKAVAWKEVTVGRGARVTVYEIASEPMERMVRARREAVA